MRDTIEMAREAGFDTHTSEVAMNVFFTEELKRFEALARADEREACAKVCENIERNGHWITKAEAAEAIRARGETK